MLFIVLFFLAISSIILFSVRRDKQTLLMMGLCFSFILMFVGIIIYLAKTGGLTQEQKLFLFFDTRIQRWLSYLIIPLRKLGYMIAVGRYLFPAFLLLIGINYSMVPLVLRHKRKSWLVMICPAVSLFLCYPEIFFPIVKGRFGLQVFLTNSMVCWMYLYVLMGMALIIHEYRCTTIPYSKKQFRYITVFLLSVTGQYLFYSYQDPVQVYQMYSSEYLRFTGRLYTNPVMSTKNWYLFTLVTIFFVIMGFWNLRHYTVINKEEDLNDVRIQRKFDTASMGVSVFVHSIKNQLLANRSLCKKMHRELMNDEVDLDRIREYAGMLEDVNESMLGRMEELYKSVKSKYISLSPVNAELVIEETLVLFHKKFPDVQVEVLNDSNETVLADVKHLSEALYNLLSNGCEAVKAAGRNEECLSLRVHSERLYIGFEVRDNGMGITKQERRKIFDPFYTSKNTNYNWGMGLYYVRQIIKSHLGMLRIDSQPGEGTSFFVMIPRYEPRNSKKEKTYD